MGKARLFKEFPDIFRERSGVGTAQGLSQWANEQAASIEKLSASVEELASTVKQNAPRISIIEGIARQGSC
jgi:methyl-accepting chemotaxis protein